MRFSTYINNQKSLEWGLNANQAALFDLLNQASSWAEEVVVDGVVYYWVSRNKVIEELPLFYKTGDTVYRHFSELNEKGLIVYLKQGKHGDKDLIRLTEKGKSWNEFKPEQIRDNSEINPNKQPELENKSEITRKQIRDNSEINPTNNNTNYKNTTDHNNKKTTQKNSLALLAEFGIVGQLAEDFLKLRKAKSAPITETALKGFQREAAKAGISLSDAITIAIERNWRGFSASWNWRDDDIAMAANTRKTSSFADDGSWAVGRKLNIDPNLIPEELR
uniref:Putative PadR-family transcriptional regulatory protein n=1 Tax=Phage sp. ct17O1 TaxID=2825789 RepID=A0A8S5PLB7_9VIRU|nr:MAG TPA: putative PadR-family transcriptional regulatory protein [Phage sp. ct17O1]